MRASFDENNRKTISTSFYDELKIILWAVNGEFENVENVMNMLLSKPSNRNYMKIHIILIVRILIGKHPTAMIDSHLFDVGLLDNYKIHQNITRWKESNQNPSV